MEANCPIKVAHVQDGKLNWEGCNNCGRCANKCPFHVTDSYVEGAKIYIGGRWGKRTAMGRPLSKIFTDMDEVLEVIDRAILLFRDEGIAGERFADTVTRLGFEYVEKKLLAQ